MQTGCGQCGAPAERCPRCAGALCARRLCAELHELACSASTVSVSGLTCPPPAAPTRGQRDPDSDRLLATHLAVTITHHRRVGRGALLAGDMDAAFDELWAARHLERQLDRLPAQARAALPTDWESETDLAPLARALSAHNHLRAGEAWRGVLDDRAARSVQAEAALWLAHSALEARRFTEALRFLHAASSLGRATDAVALRDLYRKAGLNPAAAVAVYLAVSRLDTPTARANRLRDPLTGGDWVEQDVHWWHSDPCSKDTASDHQRQAIGRARDLAVTPRDLGWVLLAEGDFWAGPLGARALGRSVRAGYAEAADEDSFLRIRLAYEGAAEMLPDMAWPAYRLAELLAWAGFSARAAAYLQQADRLALGDRLLDEPTRPTLRGLVQAASGDGPPVQPSAIKPFPSAPHAPRRRWPFLRSTTPPSN